MPIRITLSLDLRVSMSTVGTIQLKEKTIQNITSIVMGNNSNWLIPTLDKNSIRAATITGGLMEVMINYCSYSPQQSLWLPSHCTTTVLVTVAEAFSDWDSMPLQSNRPLTHTSMKQSEGEGTNEGRQTKNDICKYSVYNVSLFK